MSYLTKLLVVVVIVGGVLFGSGEASACGDGLYHTVYGVHLKEGKVYTRLNGCGTTWYQIKPGDYIDQYMTTLLTAQTTGKEVRAWLDASNQITELRLR